MGGVLLSLEAYQSHYWALRVDQGFDFVRLSYFPSPLSSWVFFFPPCTSPWVNPGILRTRRDYDDDDEKPLNGAGGLAFIYR